MNITHLDDTYDYTQIADPTLRTLAQRAAEEIKPRLRRATEDIIVIGQRLAVVQKYMPHGQWYAWLETEFDMAESSALRFIQVARRFDGKSVNLTDLKPSALYMLAAPSTPDDAIAQVETLVTNGHTPTVAETKQIITTARAALVPAPDPNGGLMAQQPQGIGVGKLLVDWTDKDWAAHNAKNQASVLDPLTDANECVEQATTWLRDYTNSAGCKWYDLNDNQIYHANSPCYAQFVREFTPGRLLPYMPKNVLKDALARLRGRTQNPADTAVVRPSSVVSPSTDNKALSPETPRDRRIAQAQSLPATTYNVVLADPPWQYNNTGVNGAAANHYNTMSFSQLSALPDQIGLDIAPNAVLFLWATNPMLADALDLIHNWGFTYKTNMVWVKDRIGTGFYVRGMHELLLICTKGAMTPINPNSTPPITSVINAPTQEHSRKPDQVHQLIEQLYPDCNYIELFARRQRAGWDVWGNEVNQ